MIQRQATFEGAVRSAIQEHYCDFNGRASRSDYWWFALFAFILGAVFKILGIFIGDVAQIISLIVSLALLLPSLGLGVRRLHDINRSGWMLLIGLIPLIGTIILIIWFCKESQMTENEYGPVPHLEN